jgi:hypothetical protein
MTKERMWITLQIDPFFLKKKTRDNLISLENREE